MADKENPNYQLLLDEINKLKQENASLKEEINGIKNDTQQVVEFNRSLLSKPAPKVGVSSSNDEKFRRFMEGE